MVGLLTPPKRCPDCEGEMELVAGKLALIDPPPIPVFRKAKTEGDPQYAALTGFLPVNAYHCPKCGLIKLYASDA